MSNCSEVGLVDEDTPTRLSSKLSLGSSPSVLSGDDDDDDDGVSKDQPGTLDSPTDERLDKKDDALTETNNGFNNDLDELFNGPLLPSGDPMDQDSASPLSSVPDDFPLSRSASPHDTTDAMMLLSPLPLPESGLDETMTNKSRRLSMAGRDIYSRLETEVGETVVEEEEEEEEEEERVESPVVPLSKDEPVSDWNQVKTEEDEDQQRHKEALEALTRIEVEFARLREKMYQEKMAELNQEAIQIANGTHPELVTLMTEIEEKKSRRIRTAEAWRKYQHGNFQRQYEGSEYQANVQFISRKAAMRRDLMSTTNGKRWRLEDEQQKLNDPSHKHAKLDAHTLRLQKQIKRQQAIDLQDIKDVIGFPRAPQVPASSQQDVRDDLLLLGLTP